MQTKKPQILEKGAIMKKLNKFPQLEIILDTSPATSFRWSSYTQSTRTSLWRENF